MLGTRQQKASLENCSSLQLAPGGMPNTKKNSEEESTMILQLTFSGSTLKLAVSITNLSHGSLCRLVSGTKVADTSVAKSPGC